MNEGALEPYAPGPDDQSVPASVADGLVRLRSRYARYDALDPTIEILDASGEQSLFTARLAPPGWRTESLKALALVGTLGHTPIASLASFLKREPWRNPALFDNPALLGGRRAWLLALSLGVAAWLARRVRRETRAWRRSPLLGAFWVIATLLLGLVGWLLFRFCEPRRRRRGPSKPRAERARPCPRSSPGDERPALNASAVEWASSAPEGPGPGCSPPPPEFPPSRAGADACCGCSRRR